MMAATACDAAMALPPQLNPVSSQEGVVRLRHTFSLGIADRLKSTGSGSDGDPVRLNLFSPDSVRKRFSMGKRSSNSALKSSSTSLNSMPSPVESDLPSDRLESPAILVSSPGGSSTNEEFEFALQTMAAVRCQSVQEDTNSLHSGQSDDGINKTNATK